VQYALSGKREEANRDFAAALANEPDGDADITAGMKIEPRMRHEFAKANLAP
jgi:hypothetical protein